jgi:glycosyltransferase involved in cell wall biosynthesis
MAEGRSYYLIAPLLERLELYARQHLRERLTVHLDVGLDATSPADVLALPYVASLFLMRRDESLAARFPNRVGWLDFAGSDYSYPHCGDTFWRWNSHFCLGRNTTVSLLRRGIKRFVFATNLMATAITRMPKKEIIRTGWYEKHHDLVYRRRYGQVGLRIAQHIDEYLWKRRFRRLITVTPRRTAGAVAYARSGILLVTNSLAAGGSERQLINTALGLSRSTSEKVGILSLLPDTGSQHFHRWRVAGSDIEIDEVPVLPAGRLDEAVEASLADLWVDVGPSDGVVETLKRLAAEFMHREPRVVHAWLDAVNIPAGLAALLTGVPRIVLSTRSVSPIHFAFLQPYMRPGYRQLVRHSDVRLLNNSDAGGRDYASWLGIPARSITTIRNGIDLDEIKKVTAEQADAYRRQIGMPAGVPVVGGVFRFNEEKRPLLWARIAAAVAQRQPNAHFLIVGDGPMRSEVRAFSAHEGFSDRLFMPGQEADVAVPLALMTCLLLSSRMEGAPNAILEAHAAGIPVVTSSAGGAPETTHHGRCGWVVEGDDPYRYADRILAVLRDPAWRNIAASLGRKLIAQRFGLERMISETLDVYGRASSSELGQKG